MSRCFWGCIFAATFKTMMALDSYFRLLFSALVSCSDPILKERTDNVMQTNVHGENP